MTSKPVKCWFCDECGKMIGWGYPDRDDIFHYKDDDFDLCSNCMTEKIKLSKRGYK